MGQAKLKLNRQSKKNNKPYSQFDQIDGDHPLKGKIEDSNVEYFVRQLDKGKVVYFNFDLAKEMGLIGKNHPNKINGHLESVILKTFNIVIINEMDFLNQKNLESKNIKRKTYMATRYLQLQHENKKGATSGDGRGIWNGTFKGRGSTWDVASCGTGATCLSPATSKFDHYFETGDPSISYGCGNFDLLDGLSGALLSEIFYGNKVATERTLAIIDQGNGIAINVRAGKNLLRPSHFFHHLKKGNYDALKMLVDYFIERQIQNGEWKVPLKGNAKYKFLLEELTRQFARAVATFEREYIFCWLDWDGDNILAADAGIIDYGSVRQFGLFHHEYRYDDVDRYSTNILEQKHKARYIVQTFIQMMDFVVNKKKKKKALFSGHPVLKYFEEEYHYYLNRILLEKIGYWPDAVDYILENHESLLIQFSNVFAFFEREKSDKGPVKVSDGITWNAVYSMRDILRELPIYLEKHDKKMDGQKFLSVISTKYAIRSSRFVDEIKSKKINQFQNQYFKMINLVAERFNMSSKKVLNKVIAHSSVINRYDRVTGDAVILLAQKLLKEIPQMSTVKFHKIFTNFVKQQILDPQGNNIDLPKLEENDKIIIKKLFKILREQREGI